MAPIGPAGSSCLSIAIAWRRAVVCCPYALLIEPKEEEPGYKSYEHPTKNWGSAHLLNGIPDAASNGEFSVPPHPTRATEAHLISSPFFFLCVSFFLRPRVACFSVIIKANPLILFSDQLSIIDPVDS